MNKIKQNRALSFICVALIYIASAIIGFATYFSLPFEFYISLLIADVVSTVFVFAFSIIFKNSSVYDPYWSVQPIIIVSGFIFQSAPNLLSILLYSAVLIWGIRLTANWAYTFKGLNFQDWRYTMLENTTGRAYFFVNFTGIHMVPTLIVYACTLPIAVAIKNGAQFNLLCGLFVLLSLSAVALQGISDVYMHIFRKNPTGNFIESGPWKYSRHPNYLAEISFWWAIALAVVSSMPNKFYLVLGAVLNTALFLSVSIPMADKRQSKKDGYDEYAKSKGKLFFKLR